MLVFISLLTPSSCLGWLGWVDGAAQSRLSLPFESCCWVLPTRPMAPLPSATSEAVRWVRVSSSREAGKEKYNHVQKKTQKQITVKLEKETEEKTDCNNYGTEVIKKRIRTT